MATDADVERTADDGSEGAVAEDDSGRDTVADDADPAGDADRYTRKQSVLITGCSSGIGRATARAFLEDDWRVFATARNVDDVDDLEEEGCETLELDVTDPEQVARTVEAVVDDAGSIDCVVNNAGYAQMGPLEDISTSDLHRQFDVNVYGPHRLTRAALPHMRAQGEGRIVNVSSVAGRIAMPGSGAYSGSKFALEGMSDALRAEVDEFDIDVVLIEPGPVETEFTNRVDEELPEDERTADYESLYELYDDAQLIGGGSGGPFAAEPEDVADAILESATSPDPPARYPVGPLAQYGLYARFLPASIRDRLYGLVRKLV